jgi:hypothetical protein
MPPRNDRDYLPPLPKVPSANSRGNIGRFLHKSLIAFAFLQREHGSANFAEAQVSHSKNHTDQYDIIAF